MARLFSMRRLLSCALVAFEVCFGSPLFAAGPQPPRNQEPNDPVHAPPADGTWHSVRKNPPADLRHIRTSDKLNPVWWFKNQDDPVPPDWFDPGQNHRSLKWFIRNPFHNLTHYVVGIGDKSFVRSGRYPEESSNPNGGWNVAVSKYRWVRLPFVSYRRGRFEFYLGWRVRGNLGAKINFKGQPKRNSTA